ncbi:G2/mitotic-specific cyclin-B1 [Platysternon megacephalum]|uniref:G2/mitotic-specific cyclin-B1 n=1 Tax=Platysternon megacephalum TaxID=55544 RepID=A0A4D9EYE0_9SAUR|nr:G2/mitotic-specific cyclin-B1 [Platysternon megacephalum]
MGAACRDQSQHWDGSNLQERSQELPMELEPLVEEGNLASKEMKFAESEHKNYALVKTKLQYDPCSEDI